jgi:tetratricopeptide (TPR) repeat protein
MMHRTVRTAAVVCFSLAAATAAWGDSAGKPPEQLGQVSFPTSCQPTVQPKFTRAVALLHSFWFVEGERAFREVLAQDPGCAIAGWGIATILIGNTFAGNATPEIAQKAQETIDRVRAIGTKSERERYYIEAVAEYWRNFGERTHGARMKSLSDAFEIVARRYPEDDEAQIFYAIYLTATQAPNDKTFAATLKAAAILEPQFAKHPEHPGVAHYLIHSYDYPPIAAKGLTAAKRYAEIAPSAPHALHMPSHIFTRVGAWQDSVATNRRAADVARAENSPSDQLHALDYMTYGFLQLARDRDAALAIEEAKTLVKLNPAINAIAYALAAMPSRYAIERGMWAEAARLEPRQSRFAFTDAITWYAKSLGAARSGDVAAAERGARELAEIAAALKTAKNEYWATEVRVQHQAALAWIAYTKGNRDDALAQMRVAADLEETSEKSPLSPGRLVPARELLGDMLAQSGKTTEALAEYERSQVRDPNRLRSLYGAGLAAAQSGNREKAKYFYARVAQLVGSSDSRSELKQVRDFLASN